MVYMWSKVVGVGNQIIIVQTEDLFCQQLFTCLLSIMYPFDSGDGK